MKRNVKYKTQEGDLIDLIELYNPNLSNGFKFYLPKKYRVLYDGLFTDFQYFHRSFDFTEDEYVNECKPKMIKIINEDPSYITGTEAEIMTARPRMENIDKLMKLASTCFIICIEFDDNYNVYNISYQTFFEDFDITQSIELYDNMEYSEDYLILTEEERNAYLQ